MNLEDFLDTRSIDHGDRSPILPSPMKPYVARFLVVEAKVRRLYEGVKREEDEGVLGNTGNRDDSERVMMRRGRARFSLSSEGNREKGKGKREKGKSKKEMGALALEMEGLRGSRYIRPVAPLI